jgi:hypothetical protein
MRKRITQLLTVIFLLLALPLLIYGISVLSKYITKASVAPADIVINAATPSGRLVPNWQSFSQGGESNVNMFKPAISQIAALKPKFIRIDHLYDFYNIVSRDGGNLSFNFATLDDVVKDILATGAQPFFSLSYMPAAISSGDIISTPKNYNEWALTVQKTIEHYSGRGAMNLQNVYYEVWNEPDLFGGFKYYGDKNYLELYRYASIGAQNAQNTNYFKLGGPSVTAYYPAWMDAYFKFIRENKLKVDFVSWHRYVRDPNVIASENDKLTELLNNYPEYNNIERLITEFGLNSENDPSYDTIYSAYYTASVYAKLRSKMYQVFAFELVDGLSPKGDVNWGRWGVMTHQSKGLTLKPRYYLYPILNSLDGDLLSATGENDFINVIPVKNGDTYKILIVNFDPDNGRVENVPITITGINQGLYNYKITYPFVSSAPAVSLDLISANEFQIKVLMDHNSLAIIDLIKK